MPAVSHEDDAVRSNRGRLGVAVERGFSLLELLIVVAVVAIIAMIAVPNVQAALAKSRRTNAYAAMKTLEGGIHAYMLEKERPPASLNANTLDPLVSERYLSKQQRTAILAALENERLEWSWGYSASSWWDHDYIICFRPKKEAPNVSCYLFPEGIWRWEPSEGWQQVL